jgi:hypothetical protein
MAFKELRPDEESRPRTRTRFRRVLARNEDGHHHSLVWAALAGAIALAIVNIPLDAIDDIGDLIFQKPFVLDAASGLAELLSLPV